MDKFHHINSWVFDLDNTLYDAETHLFTEIGHRMTEFVSKHLQISAEEAALRRNAYYRDHGTTLRGMMLEHDVPPDEFLDYVHNVDITKVPFCQITQEHLACLPGKRVVFTNSSQRFAKKLLKHLRLEDQFDGIFAIEDANYLPKPNIETYHIFLEKHAIDPAASCMFEDMEVNLKPAHDLGMTTVWLHGNAPADHDHVHHKAEKLTDWLTSTVKKK